MKIHAICLASALALTGCDATMNAGTDSNRIMTEEEYRSAVVGRAGTDGESTITANADGTISGTTPRGEIGGRWNWQDGYFCRSATVGGTALEPDCQLVDLDGSTVAYTRDQGRGERTTFTLQ